jgi:2-keto-4-pentenoate hydratase
MPTKQTLMTVLLAVTCATSASAQCLSDAQVSDLVANYVAKKPAANIEGLSDTDGACTRAKVNSLLAQRFGNVVGYKAGLTNPAVQKRFNTDKPVWGKLYEGMVLANGAAVEAAFGARPLFEADMLVRVKSAQINQAKTPMQVLEAIDQVIPFIELPDLLVQAPPKLNGAGVSAINVGARLGVAGAPLAVPAYRAERYAFLQALADMQVSLTDGAGTRLGGGKGSDILEHPLNAVVWLAQALAQEGLAMQPGDLISLGSFSPLLPPKAGLSVSATFEGLPGAEPVRVSFK